ncbi:hypothetical protein [Neotamlana laminarinivorans]|uniref:Uncharacterized protein n=1 Tax=Neotamlana laminarinivorans TaxID=2883124 RepID=A0A9X1L6A9_9FLAO|nr:hypothetical protein [Tamlana laminarinivorans]MCB4800276.1 hypothetical protein [Tamlana laminarinivorans]
MIKDIILSFKDNLKQKSTNPFFGTLIIVWIIHNWEFIYNVFNFEKGKTLAQKIEYLKLFLEPIPFIKNLGVCVLITFIVLIVTFLLLNLSRLIKNISEKKLTPWIYKISDKNSIVLKSDYDLMKNERDLLSQKLEEERDSKLKLRTEINKLEERLGKNIDGEDLKMEFNYESEIDHILNEIKQNEKNLKDFNTLIDKIHNDELIEYPVFKDLLNFLLRYDVLKLKSKATNRDYRKYEFTSFGNQIKSEFLKRK